MDEELKDIAENIVLSLADKGLKVEEAIKVLKKSDAVVRRARARMFEKAENASLKEVLKEAKGYSSPNGESP